jgi:hypothetical protein
VIEVQPSRLAPIAEPDRIIISPRIIHLSDFPGVDKTWLPPCPCPRNVPECHPAVEVAPGIIVTR